MLYLYFTKEHLKKQIASARSRDRDLSRRVVI
jgi:hypothetical protein